MNQERETRQEKAKKSRKRGLLQGIMERMMSRMMKRCPCSGMMETAMAEQDGHSDFADLMAQMTTEDGEGGFCAKMMAACCGTQVDSPKDSQEV